MGIHQYIARAANRHTGKSHFSAGPEAERAVREEHGHKGTDSKVFEVGCGTGPKGKKNALSVYQDGSVRVTNTPSNALDVVRKQDIALYRHEITITDLTYFSYVHFMILSPDSAAYKVDDWSWMQYLGPVDSHVACSGIWSDYNFVTQVRTNSLIIYAVVNSTGGLALYGYTQNSGGTINISSAPAQITSSVAIASLTDTVTKIL